MTRRRADLSALPGVVFTRDRLMVKERWRDGVVVEQAWRDKRGKLRRWKRKDRP